MESADDDKLPRKQPRKLNPRNILFLKAISDIKKNKPSQNNIVNIADSEATKSNSVKNANGAVKDSTRNKVDCEQTHFCPTSKSEKTLCSTSDSQNQRVLLDKCKKSQVTPSRFSKNYSNKERDSIPDHWEHDHRFFDNREESDKKFERPERNEMCITKSSECLRTKTYRLRSLSSGNENDVLDHQISINTKDLIESKCERQSSFNDSQSLDVLDNKKAQNHVNYNKVSVTESYIKEKSEQKTYINEKFCDTDNETGKGHEKFNKEYCNEVKNLNYAQKCNVEKNCIKFSASTEIKNEKTKDKDYCEFSKICHKREISKVNGGNYKISIQNDDAPSKSSVTKLSSSTLEQCIHSIENSENKNTVFEEHANVPNALLFEEGSFIPPPVQPLTDIEESSTDSTLDVGSISSANKKKSDSDEVLSTNGSETSYSSLPEPNFEQLEAVTESILGIVKEKYMPNNLAGKVMKDLNRLFRKYLEGNIVGLYGSYYSDLAISTSDINLIMKTDNTDNKVKKSFMREVHKLISKELKKYSTLPFEEAVSTFETRINFSEPDNGISCQLAYLGRRQDNILKMGKFLKNVCTYNQNVKPLILATKIWAETCLINEVDNGKLHPVGFALMVIHFLQQGENPLLPIYLSVPDKMESSHCSTDISVGKLWIAFLKYYALNFNWAEDVVTVKSKDIVSKKSKGWENYWMAIEDIFSGKNIADSVLNSDTCDYIKACFKASYEYFSSPPESNVSFDPVDGDSCSNENFSTGKWLYSFEKCVVDNSDAFCEACEELEDICGDCKKKNYVPPMPSLPVMTESFLRKIKEALNSIYEKYMLTDAEINERKLFVGELQKEVQKMYPKAELKLFGSSTNGFGFKNSDLDICMTFEKQEVRNTATILRDLRTLLRRNKSFDHVHAIFNAQIPIIKFHYKDKEWRGDISLNNVLAVHNSELLYTYSTIDERCRILGCALKLLAKKTFLAEVTDKALSSYSYLIMVIHFLQQTDPPILPVLQSSEFNNSHLKVIVDSWDVWFCKNLNSGENFYKEIYKVKNETPVEQLWLNLLDHYCSYEKSNFITIRQKEPLYLKENQCSARLFNIQDPFIETKNLGCVVSAKKAQETENVLKRARCLFRTPKQIHSSVKDVEDYFFSTMSLTGRIHKEAYCNLCGRFGHEQNDCKQSYFPIRRPFYNRNKLYLNRKPFNKQCQR